MTSLKPILSVLVLGLVLVTGCRPTESGSDASTSGAEPAAADALHAAFEDYFEATLELYPLRATFLGDHRYNDRLTIDIAPEFLEAERALEREYRDRVAAIAPDALGHQDRLSRDIFLRERDLALEGYRFPTHLLPVNQFFSLPSTMARLGSGQSAQPFSTVQDYDDFIGRMHDFSRWIDQAIVNMREGMASDIVQPRVLMERMLDQLDALLLPAAESLFAHPLERLPEGLDPTAASALRERYLTAIDEVMLPAYARLRAFIADEYLDAARESHGMAALPDGAAWYDWLVRATTTTDLGAAAIHEIGLAEVARIHEAMAGVMSDVGFEGSLHDFFEFTANDPRFHANDPSELLAAYEALRQRVEPRLQDLFDLTPEAAYEILPVEAYRERSAAAASYSRPAADGSRPGIFYVNTYDLSARPLWGVEALFLHEAVPGHHYQIALQQEQTHLPRFRRFGGNTAFIEGWALYAESLGPELGLYQDPYQYFGMLNAELWRAIRLVVDTGLHLHGWSREQVLDYMFENSSVGRARAVAEAERYMAIPSQALAYKVGQLQIQSLRRTAEERLGEHFDIRAFHNLVLGHGALPLDILESEVARWIRSREEASS